MIHPHGGNMHGHLTITATSDAEAAEALVRLSAIARESDARARSEAAATFTRRSAEVEARTDRALMWVVVACAWALVVLLVVM